MKHQHLAIKTSVLASYSRCANPRFCNSNAHGGHRYTEVCACGATRDVNINHVKWGVECEYGRWDENTHSYPYAGGLWRARIPADAWVLGTTEDIFIWVFRRDNSGIFPWPEGESPLFFHSVHGKGDSWYVDESCDSNKLLYVGHLLFANGIRDWQEDVKHVHKRRNAIFDLLEAMPRWAWPYAMDPNHLPGLDALERGPRPISDTRGEVLAVFGSAGVA